VVGQMCGMIDLFFVVAVVAYFIVLASVKDIEYVIFLGLCSLDWS
jgi:hypothetical protein